MLTLIKFHHKDWQSNYYNLYQCICGNQKVIRGASVKFGEIQSCGCLQKKGAHDRWFKHGLTNTPEYTSWEHMNDRCLNPNFKQWKDYGGRGIQICKEWKDFKIFLRDMGKRPKNHTLDRINNNGNYEPSNCKWSSRAEQSLNRRPYAKKTFKS